jgi:ADP-ribose pyrophosphatase YjhB (NUDIX family)
MAPKAQTRDRIARPALIPGGRRPLRGVAAIIVVGTEGYLLQLRDDRPGIAYPENGEASEAALRRELVEELSLEGGTLSYFMSMGFRFAKSTAPIDRDIYELAISVAALARLKLGEGREMRLWRHQALPELRLIPADRLALDFHAQWGTASPRRSGR